MRQPIFMIAVLTVLGACSLFGGGTENSASNAPRVEAERHQDKRFIVSYGPKRYFVDVRYIDLINESVIAVRDRGNVDGRNDLTVPVSVAVPADTPFADGRQEPVVVSIARHIRETAKICDSGRQMALRVNSDGEARVSYRSGRGAWVVFAACPAEVSG